MGINKLWKMLEPIAQKKSLLEMSVQEGVVSRRHGTGVLVIGIDASPWFYATQAIFAGHAHAQAGQNPELRTLFFRLAMLS
ncbi:hypothetical protein JR316_0006835 [Psilocybe cubensis]|uniref:Uncharacterized protein n=2 Tax=Psilocybe cubensis TaxID=181762 RepID=A0ACB8GXY2_PSICU|nr:hypothetical protein JR316_0006835 [Psilocybe cubensis]KAH9480237.1 hypothetical protein JR316_0006835 [Psilocybe cubensis]